MWELISVLVEQLAVKEVATELMEFIVTKSPKFAKIINVVKTTKQTVGTIKKYLKYVDPNELLSIIKGMPAKIINSLVSKREASLGLDFKSAQDFTKWAQNQKNIAAKDFNEMWNDYLNGDGGEFVQLSSSWLHTGQYKSTTQGIGTLTVMIRTKKLYGPYTYPAVPLKVWNMMKNAKGRNGSGAGTVFWRLYLHQFIHSALREAAYTEIFKVGGLKASKTLAKVYAKQQEALGRLNTNFYKRKNQIRLTSIDQHEWRANVLKEHKDLHNRLKGSVGQYKARYQKAKKVQAQKKERLDKFKSYVSKSKKIANVAKTGIRKLKKGR